MIGLWQRFISSEAAGGIILMGSAAAAIVVANSPAAGVYFGVLHHEVAGLDVLHWVNDALMAFFFLLVGLEIKRELLVGELASWPARALPGLAALGGMIVPALIFVACNWSSPETMRGWAIPAATDIAFSLGVLALLGSRVPASLKIFLTALAILDDLGAVVIIAVFYTADLSLPMLGLALVALLVLLVLNRLGVTRLWPYLAIGALLWVFVFRSGVHATIAGVLLAATIPIGRNGVRSPLETLEHALNGFVAYVVLPIFGFANAGVALAGVGLAAFGDPVTLGAALGLFAGKQIGVFGGARFAIAARLAVRPVGASWRQLYGVAVLCGIGFTMSLFIGLLAFPPGHEDATKIGVLTGSIASALVGWAILASGARAGRSQSG
jgi:NhaA family Na+:H+ antiporter